MRLQLAVLCLLLLQHGAQNFEILPGKSLNHQEITNNAILNVTVQTCRRMALKEGTNFNFPIPPLTTQKVAAACNSPRSSRTLLSAITTITQYNVKVDIRHATDARYHIDNEMLNEGKIIITDGLKSVKLTSKQGYYEAALEMLGKIMHPLQDFYSHSNWVELGNEFPNSNLIRADANIGNVADKNRATCRSCDGSDCTNNILEDVIEEKILTSGYFSIFSKKPQGKCSHGGKLDRTSKYDPKGGINKDSLSASHGHLHFAAANMATAATSELLEEVRRHTGDKAFLEMIGISKGSSKALCFVIDTSNSMRDNIEAVKTVTSKIIKSDSGTDMQPSSYILVTFSDPEFKLEEKTSNSKVFQKAMDSLNITGGGDKPEMSLSGLQLALTNAPFNSEIFLFTDAPAKDKNLKSTVTALIERTQTVVNFMITESSLSNRRRRRDGQNSIGAEDIQLYRDLAQASGGLVIEVTKAELSKAASIITQSTRGSEVTFLQASRNPGKSDTFTFTADETVKTLRVYITGQSVTFTITDPKGATQKSTDSSGPLIKISESVGNFIFVQLLTQVGEWKIQMESTNPYTLKVIGQSYIDFLLEFVEPSGIFSGFDVLDTRPRAGHNGTLMVSLSGSDDATITDVALVESSGSKEVKIVLEPQEGGRYFVHFDQIPRQEFDVRVTGKLAGSSNVFRRQSPISFKASNLTITANSSSIIVPGTPFSFPFSVTNSGDETTLTIRVTNNRLFPSTYPSTLPVEKGKSSTGTVTLSAPLNTPSGTDVVLTIEVATPGATDVNYIVLRFSIVNSVTDFTAPVCKRLSKKSECSGKCDSKWEVSVRVTDGADGTGIERISVSRGTGTLKTSQEAGNENITLVSYSASCCSPELQLLVVDRVGNVNNCLISGNEFSTRLAQSSFLCLSLVAVGLHLLMELGFR